MYLRAGIMCSDPVYQADKSYEQDCNWFLSNGLIQGIINGNSEDTVSSFVIQFIPYKGENLDDKIRETFLEFVSFGNKVDEKQEWVNTNLDKYLGKEEGVEVNTVIDGNIFLIDASKNYSILAVGAMN